MNLLRLFTSRIKKSDMEEATNTIVSILHSDIYKFEYWEQTEILKDALSKHLEILDSKADELRKVELEIEELTK